MRAVQIVSLDGPGAVEVVDIPEPEGKATDVIIDVRAAGVSFVDALMTRGLYQVKPELPFVPGVEVAGVVRSAPAGASVKAGDRCAAYVPQGGFAEVAVADPSVTFPIPVSLSFEEGAAFAMNYQTVHFALVHRGRLAAGERVLVHGAAGGVGTAAIQVAKGLGAEVVAVVDSEKNTDVARKSGADVVISADDDWVSKVRMAAPGGIDVVVDPVGGDFFHDTLRLIRRDGRHLVIGFAAGGIPEVAVNRLLLKNIDLVGVYWGGYVAEDVQIAAKAASELARLADAGFIRPPVGGSYLPEAASEALASLEDRTSSGKLVLTFAGGA